MSQIRTFFNDTVLSPMGIALMFWGLGWGLMLVSGNLLIAWLKNRKGMKWAPREDTPDSHSQKAGTPSMGGIGIVGAALIGFIGVYIFIYAGVMIERSGINFHFSEVLGWGGLIFPALVGSHAILGYVDDHSKATNRGGLSSKKKLLGQIVLSIAFLGAIFLLRESSRDIPTGITFDFPVFSSWFMVVIALLIIIGTSNAVNLTDGVDGLAAGLSVQVGVGFAFLSVYNFTFNFLGAHAANFWMCLSGACLGFLAFNKYPAKVFMGDTGSLALGAALGAGAILTRSVALLPFIGFIFYVEMFSVIFQVLYFKYTKRKTGEGKRIFRRAPLHHHFELGGWSEWRVVGTFWLINLCTSILGLILWKMGILPRFP